MKADLKEINGTQYVVISSETAVGPWGILPTTDEFHPSAAERIARQILEKVKEARDIERRKRMYTPFWNRP